MGVRCGVMAPNAPVVLSLCRLDLIAAFARHCCRAVVVVRAGVLCVAVLLRIIGDCAALGGAFVPVVGAIAAPPGCPVVGMHHLCARCQLQPLVVVILHMGVGAVREEIFRIVGLPRIGEHDGVGRAFSGDTDLCAVGHAPGDRYRFSGRQINVVGLAGNGVVLHHGLAADVDRAAFYIHSAALFRSRIAADLAAIEVQRAVDHGNRTAQRGTAAGELAAVHIHGAAVQIDAATAAIALSAVDAAGANAVAENQMPAARHNKFPLRGHVRGLRILFAVQTETERFSGRDENVV